MINQILEVISALNKKQKRVLLILFFVSLFSSVLELVSLISLINFVNIIANKKSLFLQSELLSVPYESLLKISQFSVVQFDGLIALIALFFSSIFFFLNVYLSSKTATKISGEIASDLYNYYIRRDYIHLINDNTSRLINNLNSEVYRIGWQILDPLLILISKFFFLVPLVVGILIYNPVITLIGFSIFLIFYILFYNLTKNKIFKKGEIQTINMKKRIQLLQETFGLLKEIKIFHKIAYFQKKFNNTNFIFTSVSSYLSILGRLPKNIIELFAFSSVIILTIYLYQFKNLNFVEIASLISVFVLSAIKILPALQQIYSSFVSIKSGMPSFNLLKQDIYNSKTQHKEFKKQIFKTNDINFSKLLFKNVSYNYQNEKELGNFEKSFKALNNLNFNIKAGEKIGISGLSGSGKSTLINLILGLIRPTNGEIIITDINLNDIISLWQKNIGFVQQNIFLINGSIKENIAFGENLDDIDINKLNKVIKMSNLNSFLKSLPDGINSIVGEKGSKISGGQSQRISIARSLYRNPSLIIFDEATNALDKINEEEIIGTILSLDSSKTVLIVSHSPNIIKKCDKVIFLDNGNLGGFDKYDNLIKNNLNFQKLVNNKKVDNK